MVQRHAGTLATGLSAERGIALLALTENQWFDRKSARSAPTDLARHLVAFANAEGGTIVVGLHADEVEGFGSHPTKINDLRQSPVDFTSPPVRATFREVECTNAAGQPDVLLVSCSSPSTRKISFRKPSYA